MNILFVCTGNIFRSMSAEYCAKKYLEVHHISSITVASAGTIAIPEPLDPETITSLARFSIDANAHIQRRVTAQIIKSADVVVAMARVHQIFLKEQFAIDVPLFNKICFDKDTSVLDLDDVMDDYDTNIPKRNAHLQKTITYIHDAMPEFFARVRNYQQT